MQEDTHKRLDTVDDVKLIKTCRQKKCAITSSAVTLVRQTYRDINLTRSIVV
ncbi:unannotated protein [freshwater metagenome]|uniref:Unannotated protein n=1 Tax=freshwater metagenome TaxID=449393 RepID=A0A6J7PRS3_9ZZZZ